MKKIITLLLSLSLLSACGGNHYSSVSDKDEVLFKTNDGTSYTKENLYEDMKANDVTDLLKISLIKKLASYEGIDADEVSTKVTESANAMVEAGYESFITSYYGSLDSYINSSIANELLTSLCENEINNNFDSYVEDYTPYKAEIVYFDNKDSAQAVIDAVNNVENTFEYACTENGYDSEVTSKIYSDNDTDLPVEVKEWVLNATETGVSDIIEVSTAINDSDGNSVLNPRYYLVNLESKNVEDFKDDFITLVENDMDKDSVINNLLAKYNLEIHDQRVYEMLSSTYEAAK